jgi:hypothetical protein
VDLCVGVTSRLVAEEAAKLGVAQIIASRRQVNETSGYTGMTQRDLVKLVKDINPKVQVIRDHGGPFQNGNPHDDWVRELDEDERAGFDGLHLDVSQLQRNEQVKELQRLINRYAPSGALTIQVGGERDTQAWLFVLLAATLETGARPSHCVIALGGHALCDKQCGELLSPPEARHITYAYNALGVKSVAHNADFTDRSKYSASVNAMNVAPEYGVIEMEAWLRAAGPEVASELLKEGYESRRWLRWFSGAQGTRYERARCGLRYIWAELLPDLQKAEWYPRAEQYVRQEVSDAIAAG